MIYTIFKSKVSNFENVMHLVHFGCIYYVEYGITAFEIITDGVPGMVSPYFCLKYSCGPHN